MTKSLSDTGNNVNNDDGEYGDVNEMNDPSTIGQRTHYRSTSLDPVSFNHKRTQTQRSTFF